VLAPAVVGDPDARARFDREARAVSSLNHPHICALYDVGHQDGLDYLVLEFLEGETLAARMARGTLPRDQALRIAVEICEALEAAHRAGLTHRDLKPANVMLTRGGVKLLDFGLAKPCVTVVSGHASGSAHTLQATQLTAPLTSQGTLLGTVHYMAPEQIEGREADARTDLWAFGCVLYEMLGGMRPFEGATTASLIAAILERDPPPIPIPSGSDRLWDVLRTCLEKNPDDRWQSARDLARELRWCAASPPASSSMSASPAFSRRSLLAGAGAAVASIAGVSLWLRRGSSGAAVAAGPPVVVLMDSTHPERVYDEQTRKAGGTNADDLTDLLRDLPVVLLKENTNITWRREYEVLRENPSLIVAHRSCFYDATIIGEASRETPFINLSWDKFETFAGLIGQASPRTKILAYSRGSWADEAARLQWIRTMEQRFPPLRGRIDAMRVPLDRATFRNQVTGDEIRRHIVALLQLEGRG
jgi:serine/threonine protein kinase